MLEARTTIHDIAPDDFVDGTVERVSSWHDDQGNPWYEITYDKSMCFGLDGKYGIPPQVGDALRVYGKGFGYRIRGVALNGVVLYYRTEEEDHALFKRQIEESNERQHQEYLNSAAEREQAIALLPEIFQARLAKMRRNNPNFWQIEPYELFVCQEALKIVEVFDTVEGVNELYDAPHDEQRTMVPSLDMDNHSGNTFGAACLLANLYLQNPTWVLEAHAAMAPLLGCTKAGCHTDADFQDGPKALPNPNSTPQLSAGEPPFPG